MSDKRFWPWLLLLAIYIAGCGKTQPADRTGAPAKGQPAQAVRTTTHEPPYYSLGKETFPSASRTWDMTSYNWPADFKLPLVINMEIPEVPKEIENPSPPIEEKK